VKHENVWCVCTQTMKPETLTLPMTDQRKAEVEKTVKKERRRLLGFIRKRVRNDEDANDIVQDVFLQLASAVEPIGNMTAWLFRVARNRITDTYRKKMPERLEEVFSGDDEEDSVNWQELIPSVIENPLHKELLWDALMAALEEIPAEQADVFMKNELQGITFKQLSAASGDPIPTLISRKRYAIIQLREKLRLVYEEILND
jgi:RNA polymerase sigma factor (sigma-70 family)